MFEDGMKIQIIVEGRVLLETDSEGELGSHLLNQCDSGDLPQMSVTIPETLENAIVLSLWNGQMHGVNSPTEKFVMPEHLPDYADPFYKARQISFDYSYAVQYIRKAGTLNTESYCQGYADGHREARRDHEIDLYVNDPCFGECLAQAGDSGTYCAAFLIGYVDTWGA
jgi:hypothetical protein